MRKSDHFGLPFRLGLIGFAVVAQPSNVIKISEHLIPSGVNYRVTFHQEPECESYNKMVKSEIRITAVSSPKTKP